MWRERLSAVKGAALSAWLPRYGANERRLRARIESLARGRGVASWFDRFEGERIAGPAGQLHIDTIAVDEPAGTFVFMPGTNAYGLLYGEFLTAISEHGWNIVAFDPRGHGRSEGKRGSYTMPELIADFEAVVSYARTRFGNPLVVSGSSQGGITALYYATTDPELAGVVCHNLADLSDPSSGQLTRLGAAANWVQPLVEMGARSFPEWPVPMQSYLNLRREPVRGQPHALHILLEDPLIPWFVRLKTLASLASTPPPRPLGTLAMPVLVLQAGRDTIFPTNYVRKTAKHIADVQFELFDDLAHYMIVDDVDQVVPVVARWLNE